MSEQKPRKFRALKEISESYYPSDYSVRKGEVLTFLYHYIDQFSAVERPRKGSVIHSHWYYGYADFEEVFEDESKPIETIDHLPIQSLLPTKVSIDDLIKLRSTFAFDEILEMIEKGIV